MSFRPSGVELDATEPRRKKNCSWVYKKQLEPANAGKRASKKKKKEAHGFYISEESPYQQCVQVTYLPGKNRRGLQHLVFP